MLHFSILAKKIKKNKLLCEDTVFYELALSLNQARILDEAVNLLQISCHKMYNSTYIVIAKLN